MNSGIYIMRDGSRLIARPNQYDEVRRISIEKHIQNLQTLIQDHPALNFFVFHLEKPVDSPFNPLNPYFPTTNRGQEFSYFQANQSVGFTVGSLSFSSLNKLFDSHYKTGHHWNIHGIQKAYENIYQILKEKHPDLTPPQDLSDIQSVPIIKFLDFYARETLYPITGENFEVSLINLPS
jgi:hypothetical protein